MNTKETFEIFLKSKFDDKLEVKKVEQENCKVDKRVFLVTVSKRTGDQLIGLEGMNGITVFLKNVDNEDNDDDYGNFFCL